MNPEEQEWKKLKRECYGKNIIEHIGRGCVDFSPEGLKDLANAEGLSYSEYLNIQRRSVEESEYRTYLDLCYYHGMLYDFKATISRKTNDKILFQRLYVDGMYPDGIGFEGREQHIWMDLEGFEDYSAGDSVAFKADIYRYLKTGTGKLINLSLRNPTDIEKIQEYDIPTDEALIKQQYDNLICEVCLFCDQCYMGNCMAPENYHDEMFDYLKTISDGRFNPITVFAAYEKAGMVVTQMVHKKLLQLPEDYNHPLSKMVFDSWLHPAPCCMDLDYALSKIFQPEKPRLYYE